MTKFLRKGLKLCRERSILSVKSFEMQLLLSVRANELKRCNRANDAYEYWFYNETKMQKMEKTCLLTSVSFTWARWMSWGLTSGFLTFWDAILSVKFIFATRIMTPYDRPADPRRLRAWSSRLRHDVTGKYFSWRISPANRSMYFRGVRVEGQVAPAAVVAPQVAFLEGTNDPVNHDASGEKWVFREESNSVALAWFNKVCLRCPKCEGPMIQNNVILCRKCGFVAQADDVKKGYCRRVAHIFSVLQACAIEFLLFFKSDPHLKFDLTSFFRRLYIDSRAFESKVFFWFGSAAPIQLGILLFMSIWRKYTMGC